MNGEDALKDAIPTHDRVRIKKVQVLSDDWYVLRNTTFNYQRRDGAWPSQSRETYDRGNRAMLLLYNQAKQTVILTRQFRFPAFVNEHDGMLSKTCAGLLARDELLACIQHSP